MEKFELHRARSWSSPSSATRIGTFDLGSNIGPGFYRVYKEDAVRHRDSSLLKTIFNPIYRRHTQFELISKLNTNLLAHGPKKWHPSNSVSFASPSSSQT